jgi:hypothetical protein
MPLGVVMDSSGNLFGFCKYGGPNDDNSLGDGTVFELPAGSSTISVLSSFTSATGYNPATAPVFDASGNLFGQTDSGGANTFGTVFGIATGSTPAPASSDARRSVGGHLADRPADLNSKIVSDIADLNRIQLPGGIVQEYNGNVYENRGTMDTPFFTWLRAAPTPTPTPTDQTDYDTFDPIPIP